MTSPEEHETCVKCDMLLCQELGVSSPHLELQTYNLEQRESVKRNLNFSDDTQWLREFDDNSELSLGSTISHTSNHDFSSELESGVSSSDSEDAEKIQTSPKENVALKETHSESTEDCTEHEDLYCDEVLSPSPEKIAYLRKRQRSMASVRFNSTSVSLVGVTKKQRLNF